MATASGPHSGEHFPRRHGGIPVSSCTTLRRQSVNSKPSLDRLDQDHQAPCVSKEPGLTTTEERQAGHKLIAGSVACLY